MKTHINSSELALLMDIPASEAKGKILYCLPANSKEFDERFPKVEIKTFEKAHKIDLTAYLEDTWNNFFKRPRTRGWALDYPRKKIWHGEAKPIPNKISLPKALSGLINPEVLDQIKIAWEEKYNPILPRDVQIEFKP